MLRARGPSLVVLAVAAFAAAAGSSAVATAPPDSAPPPEIRAGAAGSTAAAPESAGPSERDAAAALERDRAADERELRALREEIERARERARDLRGREAGILQNLDSIDREISLQDRLLRGLYRKRGRIEEELEAAREEYDAASAELERREGLLRRRLRSMYTLGKYHEYEVLLGSTSFVDLVRRFDFLLSLAMRDRELTALHARQKEEVARRARGLEMVAEEIAAVEEEAEMERERLLDRRDARERILAEVRTERRAHETALAELEESSSRLRSLIGSLEDERAVESARGAAPVPEGSLSGRAGRLSWPADGPVVARFGRHVHPKFGTETINNGIDIGAPEGADIRCVADGRVDFVSSLPGYGNCVIVNHGDGFYTLYAHASEVLVEQGALVEEGRVIARVGSTGSLSGSLLHFEIREGRKPVDPLEWLRGR